MNYVYKIVLECHILANEPDEARRIAHTAALHLVHDADKAFREQQVDGECMHAEVERA